MDHILTILQFLLDLSVWPLWVVALICLGLAVRWSLQIYTRETPNDD